MATTTLTFDVDLQATPDQVWQTLTDPDTVPRWWFGMTFETDWRPGTRLSSQSPDGVGTVLAAAAGRAGLRLGAAGRTRGQRRAPVPQSASSSSPPSATGRTCASSTATWGRPAPSAGSSPMAGL
ncbi:MAG: SRPBCC domain-containing protein [Frankiaceae bacterium]